MSNKPSKQLMLFLEQTGAIHGSPEEIALAKAQYRKAYKKTWKQNAPKSREIRVTVTPKQYACIEESARTAGTNPTDFLRQLGLNPDAGIIPNKDILLHILQLLRMARCAGDSSQLADAEALLLRYLKQ